MRCAAKLGKARGKRSALIYHLAPLVASCLGGDFFFENDREKGLVGEEVIGEAVSNGVAFQCADVWDFRHLTLLRYSW